MHSKLESNGAETRLNNPSSRMLTGLRTITLRKSNSQWVTFAPLPSTRAIDDSPASGRA